MWGLGVWNRGVKDLLLQYGFSRSMEKEKFVKNRFVSNTQVLILSPSHLSKYQVVLEIASTLYGVQGRGDMFHQVHLYPLEQKSVKRSVIRANKKTQNDDYDEERQF